MGLTIPTGSKKGGGGMDIATRRDALADAFTKAAKKAMGKGGKGMLSMNDINRAFAASRGMISPAFKAADKKAGGGKAMKKKKMMAKGGAMGGKKMSKGGAMGGKKKAMMQYGGKTKKMMSGGGRTKGAAAGGKKMSVQQLRSMASSMGYTLKKKA